MVFLKIKSLVKVENVPFWEMIFQNLKMLINY